MSMKNAKRLVDLLVVVGPSGAGKSTLITKISEEFPTAFGYSISHTTRDARTGEVNGESYHFVDEDTFKGIIEEGKFIEHAVVHDTYYGTSEKSVEDVTSQNRVCTMDIDIIGAQNLRKHPTLRTLIVFVSPPSMDELETRLRNRGTESEEKIQKRLNSAVKEMKWFEENSKFFDHTFTNDDLDECYVQFREAVMGSAFVMPTHHR